MSRYVSEKLRIAVAKRANHCCEYCLLPENKSFFTFHIEHIISLKHGGTTSLENLAFSCQICNLNKGSDLGTFVNNPLEIIHFFNPRIDTWATHFELDETGFINPLTSIGAATLKILELNQVESIIERKEMIIHGLL